MIHNKEHTTVRPGSGREGIAEFCPSEVSWGPVLQLIFCRCSDIMGRLILFALRKGDSTGFGSGVLGFRVVRPRI